MIPKPLAVTVLTLITLVWLVDFGAQFVPGLEHQPSPAIQATFLAIVGGALIRAGWVARKQLDEPHDHGANPPPTSAQPPQLRAAPPPDDAGPGPEHGRHRTLLVLRKAWT